jgi:fluoride exporter
VDFDRLELTAVFIGGLIGTIARALLVDAVPTTPGSWPWPTFIANVVGTLALGYFTTRLQERMPLSAYRRPLLGTGLCGGLTTFSTMQIELVRLAEGGDAGLALAYAAASVALGLLALHAATKLVRRTGVA